MTKQEIFNRVWDWFVTQGKPLARNTSDDGRPACLYRVTREGVDCRCALGLFIPHDNYRPDLEGKVIYDQRPGVPAVVGSDVDETLVAALEEGVRNELLFLHTLQAVHDHASEDPFMRNTCGIQVRLRDFARMSGLEVPA